MVKYKRYINLEPWLLMQNLMEQFGLKKEIVE